jgi:AraC-like DNA-binding protein
VRYIQITSAPFTFATVEDEELVRLLVGSERDAGATRFIAEYEASLVIHHLRAETKGRVRVAYVSLMHKPDDHRDLERLLACPVRAPSTWNGVAFPRDTMRVPLRRRDPALRRVLEGHAADVVSRAPAIDDQSIAKRVHAVITSRLGRGVPDIRVAARQLAMSRRSLQRRLADEGVSYVQIVEQARRMTAERLLADASLAVSEIGYLLGFSEPSAFHRAFKRWYHMTPQEYRNARRQH